MRVHSPSAHTHRATADIAGHTPGPWLYVEGERLSHDAEGWEVWAVMPAIVSLETGEPVVDDAEFIDPRDARLIAAAPDLLEALENLVNAVGDHPTTTIDEADASARAAIAKATGQ